MNHSAYQISCNQTLYKKCQWKVSVDTDSMTSDTRYSATSQYFDKQIASKQR